MTLGEMRIEIARNLGILSSTDETTILESRVTEAGMSSKINQIYRDVIAQTLMNKYPSDFENDSEPLPTYTASFSVLSIAGTTLLSSTDTFSKYDVGCKIQNPTEDEYVVIESYVSSTEVILESAPSGTWTGDVCYVLNDYFLFEDDLEDLKEIIDLKIKYKSGDNEYTVAKVTNNESRRGKSNSDYSTSAPKWDYTSIQSDDGTSKRAAKIFPRPTNYDGAIELRYTSRPPAMGLASDIPKLEVIGISEILINGTTAWGFGILEGWRSENTIAYKGLYNESLESIVRKYRPKSRSKTFTIRPSAYYDSIQKGSNIYN